MKFLNIFEKDKYMYIQERSTGIGVIEFSWCTGVLLRTGANWDRRVLFTGDKCWSLVSMIIDDLARRISTFLLKKINKWRI